uniref:Fe2OG dioxygenase domain-containing protein n=1 Tax=Cannabis sativa TaxID=3483 RepID=A0A803Q915_CANSA
MGIATVMINWENSTWQYNISRGPCFSALEAELQAVKSALVWALQNAWIDVTVVSDSQIVVQALEKKRSIPDWSIYHISVSVLDLIKQFNSCVFRYVNRNLNSFADGLAKKVRVSDLIVGTYFGEGLPPVETALEFSTRTREVASKVVKAISETLGLEEDCISKAMNWDEGLQLLAANYYPACPEPDRAIGIPPHTDHGLVTLLIQNEISGLQVQHKGQWVMLEAITNAFVVNLGDQMQVVTNGKYKSVRHRAVVNNTKTRISIAVPHGPSVDTVVVPLPELLEREGQSPVYSGMSYKDYIELQQSSKCYMKSSIDMITI